MRRIYFALLMGLVLMISGCASDTGPDANSSVNSSDGDSGNSTDLSDSGSESSTDPVRRPEFSIVDDYHNISVAVHQGYVLEVGEDFETRFDIENTGNGSGVFSSTLVARHTRTGIEKNFSVRSGEEIEPGEEVGVNKTMSLGHFGDYIIYRDGKQVSSATTDLPEMVEFGDSESTDTGITVKADNLRYRDSYSYTEDGEEVEEETDFYEAFILVDLSFENTGNETFSLPERSHFKWDITSPVDIRNGSDIQELDYGRNLSSGESTEGTVVFRDSVNSEHNYPDSLLLEYEDEGLGARWNVTEEDYFEEIGREP